MGKQRSIRLNLNNTYDEKGFDLAKEKVDYEPICVFTENKPRRAFYRGTRTLTFFVNGTVKAIRFAKDTTEIQSRWTMKESEEFVEKEIAKAHAELKPIKTWQFVVIMVFLVLNLILLLNVGGYIRVGR